MSVIDVTKNATVRNSIKPGDHHVRMQRLRDQERQRRFTITGLSVVSIAIGCLVLIAIADFDYQWNAATRLAALACVLGTVITTAMVMRRWLKFDALDAVCEAEKAWPEVGQRLRTSHDYQSYPDRVSMADPSLLSALELQTAEQVMQHPVKPLGKSWPIAVLTGFCSVAALTWLGMFVFSSEWRIATARLWMLPLHYSTVVPAPIPDTIEQGDDLHIRLHVEGRPIESAIVQYRAITESTWKQLPMTPNEGTTLVGELTAVLPDCRHDMQLKILADPLDDAVHAIAVRLPLVVEQWQVKVQPPAYTGLGDQTFSADDARIPAGSKIALSARFNREPATVDLELSPATTFSGAVVIENQLAGMEIDAGQESIDVRVVARTADGVEHESTLLLNVIPDRPPVIQFLSPQEECEAIATAELRFTVEAYDDYGIDSLELRYRIDDGEETTLWQSSADDAGSAVSHSVVLPLEDLGVSYPQAITYYAVATDHSSEPGRRANSELRFVDIRPFVRDYEFSDSQCNCQGECVTLEKLIKDQREILAQTFTIVRHGSADRSSSNARGMQLTNRQNELKDQTATLAQALAQKIGPVIELNTAVDWMADAVEDLQASEFESGQHAEEKSLASLIAARTNLRVILKQGNSQSKQVRQIDQLRLDQVRKQQQQTSDKTAKDEPSTFAEMRERLDQLAQDQESFCRSAGPIQDDTNSSAASSQTGQIDSPDSPPNVSDWAKAQKKSEQQARQIQSELADGMFGELAIKRSEQAAQAIASSAQALANVVAPEATEWSAGEKSIRQALDQAEVAAKELRSLSEHLGRRHLPDFNDKLAAAQRGAERLSEDQGKLNQTIATASSAETIVEQQDLHRRAEELDDLIDQLLIQSSEQDGMVQDSLRRITSDHAPRQAVAMMASAVQWIASDQSESAVSAGRKAAETLQSLASGLKTVQQAMGPARMEELVVREKQAAALLKELKRATTGGQQAYATSQASQLIDALQPLSEDDPELALALEEVGKFHTVSTSLFDGIRQIDEILQHRIQEAVLGGVLQQSVGPVPPEYSDIVDEYYRVLSQDIE